MDRGPLYNPKVYLLEKHDMKNIYKIKTPHVYHTINLILLLDEVPSKTLEEQLCLLSLLSRSPSPRLSADSLA
jgi:hypothetical protein